LQEKFDKHMKNTNNVIQDRKEDIDRLNQRVATLQGFYDEQQEFAESERQKNEKAMNEVKEKKDEEIQAVKTKLEATKTELEELKIDSR